MHLALLDCVSSWATENMLHTKKVVNVTKWDQYRKSGHLWVEHWRKNIRLVLDCLPL